MTHVCQMPISLSKISITTFMVSQYPVEWIKFSTKLGLEIHNFDLVSNSHRHWFKYHSTITHCLGLGHETMVSAACLSIFLLNDWRHCTNNFFNLFNCGSYNLTSEFIDVMWSFSFLVQKINKNSASLIDNIFTNNYNIFYVFFKTNSRHSWS